MNYKKHFRPRTTCLGICIRKFRGIVDVLAVFAGAPRSSMQLGRNGLQLVLSNLLLSTFGHDISSLPFRGWLPSKVHLEHLSLPSIEQSNAFLILTVHRIQNAQLTLQKHPTDHSTTINTAVLKEHLTVSWKFGACSKQESDPWFPTPHPASPCSCQVSKAWKRPRNDITNSIPADIGRTGSSLSGRIRAIQKIKFAILLTSLLLLSSALS